MKNLEAVITELMQEIADLKAHIAKQDAQIADLLKRLHKNSSNSGKPPSSDGLKKPPPKPVSLRDANGAKKSGGQPGHKGHTAQIVENPDVIKIHGVDVCEHCAYDLHDVIAKEHVVRQVIDIPVVKPEVTEHRLLVKECPCCRKKTKAKSPTDVNAPIQYGTNIQAISVYLTTIHFVPEDRLQILLLDLFKVSISTASLVKFSNDFSDLIEPTNQAIEKELKESPIKHLDESGFRMGGATCWLHVMSNGTHTFYSPRKQRGDIPTGVKNIVVHDHFKSYDSMDGVEHVFCNAHHLRELKSLMENEKEPWARHMFLFLKYLSHIAKSELTEKSIEKANRIYNEIVAKGLAYHESLDPLPQTGKRGRKKHREGHNLLLRLQNHAQATLRFLENPEIPFTNNQAEQDIRMMKVKQKISGGFRTEQGAQKFCNIRGLLSTCRKQGVDLFQAIRSTILGDPPDLIPAQ
jgi:transposase